VRAIERPAKACVDVDQSSGAALALGMNPKAKEEPKAKVIRIRLIFTLDLAK
jgi:hypothetical protein